MGGEFPTYLYPVGGWVSVKTPKEFENQSCGCGCDGKI
jgi:hypothetical protein